MEKVLFAGLPPGASHQDIHGRFLKKYSMGWLYWDNYHKSWTHWEGTVQIRCEVGEP